MTALKQQRDRQKTPSAPQGEPRVDRGFLGRLEVAGNLENRDVVLRFVSAVCRMAHRRWGGVTSERKFTGQVVSAVGEVFNNIALHGYAGRDPGLVILKLDQVGDALSIHISDFGTGFDPDRVKVPDLGSLPESGLGVFIIRSFVDDFRYQRGTPNSLQLSKRIG